MHGPDIIYADFDPVEVVRPTHFVTASGRVGLLSYPLRGWLFDYVIDWIMWRI